MSINRDLSTIDPKQRGLFKLGQEGVAELRRIAEKNDGILRAQDVVKAARSEDSPLHSRFEWDDDEAAEKFRLIQARLLINISVDVAPGSKIPTRVFVSLSTDRGDGGGYRTAVDVMSDREMRQQLLSDALESMENFRERYRRLKELSSVISAIGKTSKKLRENVKS